MFHMFDDATDMADDAALSGAGDFIRTRGGSHEAGSPGGGCEVIREAPSSTAAAGDPGSSSSSSRAG